MTKKGVLIILISLLTFPLFAQLKYANVLFEEQNYLEAIPLYERVIEKKGESVEVVEKLAYCYKVVNDYKNAEKYFAKAVTFDEADPTSHLYYGQLLKNNNRINQAREQFIQYNTKKPGSLIGKLMLKSCDNIMDWSSQPVEYAITNLEAINSPLNEIGPFPYKEGIIFTSETKFLESEDEKKKSKEEETPSYSIYYMPYDQKGNAGTMQSFFGRNAEDDFEGPAYLNQAQDLVYYNKVFDTRRYLVNQIKIYSSSYSNGVWGEPEGFPLNSNEYTITNPVLSVSEDTLFFASDMKGGYGGMDIYYCVRHNGEWGIATNLGPLVNTEGIEIPSHYNSKQELFFSSNFHPGYGGFDIFKSKWNGSTWSNPENLKSPLNSSKDELGYIPVSEELGYFSSNRDGGFGKDDIYRFGRLDTNDLENYTTVSGVFEYQNLPMEDITLNLLDENDVLIQTAVTDENGQFEFNGIPPGVKYQIIVDEPDEKIPDGAKLYLTNSKNQKVKLLSQIRKGMFKFEALKSDEYDDLPLMSVEDDELPRLTILGEIYNKLSMDLPEGMEVMLYDDENNLLGSAKADENGEFKFTNLKLSEKFLLRLSEKDPNLEINILNSNKELLVATTRDENGDFVYLTNLQKSVKNPDIVGVFKYGKLPASDVQLNLMDENDEFLSSTKTDQDGGFKFSALNAGSNYSIQVDKSAGKIPKNASMYLKDAETGRLLPVAKNGKGTFNFKTLAYDEAEPLALMSEPDDDAPRVNLLGEVYHKLAHDLPEDLEVYLLDDDGNIIAKAKTLSNGTFAFNDVQQKDKMLLRLSSDDKNLQMKIINKQGQLLGITKQNSEGDFVYLTNLQKAAKNPDIAGVFKYGTLPASDVQLNLMNDQDEMIQFTKTDANGEFEFQNLEAGKNYAVQVDKSAGEIPDNAEMFLKDKYTGMLLPVSKNGKGSFKFETLAYDEAEPLALMSEPDDDAPRVNLLGEVYHKLAHDLPEDLEVYLLDDDGNIIAKAKTLSNGTFAFNDVQQKDKMLLRLSSDDKNLQMKIINKQGQLLGITKQNSEGDFVYLTNLQKAAKNPDIAGVFKYGTLPASDVQLNLMNDQDEMIQFTKTDANGEFEFQNLEAGKNYAVQVDKSAGEIPDNAEMFLKDKYTGMLLPVSKNGKGTFKFETLAYDEAEPLTLMSEPDDAPAKHRLLSEIKYEKLPMDLPEGMELYLMDDDDNIISKTKVDKNGQFRFNELAMSDEQLKALHGNNSPNLRIVSKGGKLIANLNKNNRGEYIASLPTKDNKQASSNKPKPAVVSTEVSDSDLILYFDFSSSDLSKQAVDKMDKIIAKLKAEPSLKINVKTHADSRGTEQFNMWLGKRRASLILQYLILEGIEYQRITVKSYGESQLSNHCDDNTECTEKQHAQNRRAEFEFITQ